MQFKREEPLEWTVYEHDNLNLLHYYILNKVQRYYWPDKIIVILLFNLMWGC